MSLEAIKRKIASVQTTAKITKAMHLVASSKLRKQKKLYLDIQDYYQEYYNVVGYLLSICGDVEFLKVKNAKDSRLYIVINSTMGLCGSYNANVSKLAYSMVRPQDKIIVIGRRGVDFWKTKKMGDQIINTYNFNDNEFDYDVCARLGADILRLYKSGEVNEIKMLYTKFVNALTFNATKMDVIPFDKSILENQNLTVNALQFDFEPGVDEVVESLLPSYMATMIYGSYIESKVSENASRRNAMDTATKNANELIDKYKLQYNRVRQSNITNEITEIIAGSGAN